MFFHANPDSGKALGQILDRKNRGSGIVDLQAPDTMTTTDLNKFVTQPIRLMVAGKLQARKVTALRPLCNLQLRRISNTDLESRVEKL